MNSYAQVDGVNTMPPGSSANVSLSVIGNTLHFTCDLPKGEVGSTDMPPTAKDMNAGGLFLRRVSFPFHRLCLSSLRPRLSLLSAHFGDVTSLPPAFGNRVHWTSAPSVYPGVWRGCMNLLAKICNLP